MPEQRVVLVTGSTGGLGRETAIALTSQGDHVIVHGRNIVRVLRSVVVHVQNVFTMSNSVDFWLICDDSSRLIAARS